MRKLVFCVLLCCCSQAWAGWAFVRINTAATGASTNPNVVALNASTALHNVLVATFAFGSGSSAMTISGVSGRCNSTWTYLLRSQRSSTATVEIWYCLDGMAGAGNVSGTVTGATPGFVDGYVTEYSFTAGATVSIDGTAAATNGSSAAAATGTVTTAGTDDLILASGTMASATAASNSFNLRSTADGNAVADRIVTSATGYTTTFTTGSGAWVTVIGALKAVGAAGAVRHRAQIIQ